jgi:hypothetical protein
MLRNVLNVVESIRPIFAFSHGLIRANEKPRGALGDLLGYHDTTAETRAFP